MKIKLVPLTKEHAKISYQWRNNHVIWKQTLTCPTKNITLNIEEAWFDEISKRTNEKRFAIIDDENI